MRRISLPRSTVFKEFAHELAEHVAVNAPNALSPETGKKAI